jgi:hypothetical protein
MVATIVVILLQALVALGMFVLGGLVLYLDNDAISVRIMASITFLLGLFIIALMTAEIPTF